MLKGIVIGTLSILLIMSAVACGDDSTPIKATWVSALIDGDTASIPVNEIESNTMTHFGISTAAGDISFMAYKLGENIYVRSNICPPCRSVGFSLKGNTLVCDSCATTFDAKTGEGIEGACVDFPKASVPYKISDGNMLMDGGGLVRAHQNTLTPGLP
jgi:nitrite reductase/ring-hydroxylating ferredoxin subunit